MTSDLASVVDRARQLDRYLACGVGRSESPAARWWTAEQLGEPGGTALDALADAYASAWEVVGDRRSQATLILLDYTWYATAPLVAAYLLDRACLSLAGAAVALDPATRTGSLALADLPPHRAGSVAELRDEVERHISPLVAELGRRRWLRERVSWMGIGDRIVGAFEYLGDLVGDPSDARREANELVHAAGTRLDSPRHCFEAFEHRGISRVLGLRASCCRFYRTRGGDYCTTCPLLREAERRARVCAEIDAAFSHPTTLRGD